MRKVSIPLEERRLIQAIRRPAGGFLPAHRPANAGSVDGHDAPRQNQKERPRHLIRRRLESTAMNTSNSDGDEICRQ